MAALVGTAIVAVLPELVKTQEYIAKELDRLGISYKKNKNDSGIIGEIKGGHSGKTILFRLLPLVWGFWWWQIQTMRNCRTSPSGFS